MPPAPCRRSIVPKLEDLSGKTPDPNAFIGTLNNVSSSGAVNVNWQFTSFAGQDAGGLVGRNFGQINNSFTSSNVTVTTAGDDAPGNSEVIC